MILNPAVATGFTGTLSLITIFTVCSKRLSVRFAANARIECSVRGRLLPLAEGKRGDEAVVARGGRGGESDAARGERGYAFVALRCVLVSNF